MDEHILAVSSNRGRYSFDDPEGHDLSTGEPIEILIGGNWIRGRVEHSGYPTEKYPDVAGLYSITGIGERIGYYFVAQDGSVCGLCVGMRVRKW